MVKRIWIIALLGVTLTACNTMKSSHRIAAEEMVNLTHNKVLTPIFSESFAAAAKKKGVLREAFKEQMGENVSDECFSDMTDVGTDFATYLFSSSMVTDMLADSYEQHMDEPTINAFNTIVQSDAGTNMLTAVTSAKLGKTSTADLPKTIKDIALGAANLFAQDNGKTLATSMSTIIPAYSNVIGTLGADKSALKQQFVTWMFQNPTAREKLMNAAKTNTSCCGAIEAVGTVQTLWDVFSPTAKAIGTPKE
jgi:hypothetical protein